MRKAERKKKKKTYIELQERTNEVEQRGKTTNKHKSKRSRKNIKKH